MKLIDRNTAISDNEFASFLSGWQRVGDPADNEALEAGNYFDEATNEVRFFTQEELDNIRQRELNDIQQLLDVKLEIDVPVTATLVIDNPSDVESIDYFTNLLVDFRSYSYLRLIFIPFYKTNWFNDSVIETHHPDVRTAYTRFKGVIGLDDYTGGIVISSETDFRKFLPLYFTLVEGNYIPRGFFYSEELRSVLSYHASGELWFYCFSTTDLERIESYIRSNQLTLNEKYTWCNS